MKCRNCKRAIDDDSLFCKWCGKEQQKKKDEISVPKPHRKADGTYTAQIMVNGVRVSVPPQPTETKYYAAARAMKVELVEIKDKAPNITLAEAIDRYIAEKPSLKSTTKQNYVYIKENRFPDLMKKKIGSITMMIWKRQGKRNRRDLPAKAVNYLPIRLMMLSICALLYCVNMRKWTQMLTH